MYKGKDGKVFASLTEVKNKTGDIFALVDEYGEVTLTSYNKPRYKISKIDLLDVLDISEEGSTRKPESAPKANVLDKVKSTVTSITARKPAESQVNVASSSLLREELFKSFSNLKKWDRNSSSEKKFVSSLLKPLQ